jgi:hypothetical protein
MMMNTKWLFLVWVMMGPIWLIAQSSVGSPEIGPDAFMHLDKEPIPMNLDSVKGLIDYPWITIEAEIDGIVVVRVLVDESGKYLKHIHIKDPHPILSRAVLDKLHLLSFTPGMQGNKPVKVWITIPFEFKITYFSLEEALAANPKNVIELNLAYNGLEKFPMEVLKFPRLRSLELAGNSLTSIPSEIDSMKLLQYLGLASNQLTALPEFLFSMPSLTRIQIQNNRFPTEVQKSLVKHHKSTLYPKAKNGKVVWQKGNAD